MSTQMEIVTIDEIEKLASKLQDKITQFTQQHDAYKKMHVTFQVNPEETNYDKEITRAKAALEELRKKESERTKLVSLETEILTDIETLRKQMKIFRYQYQIRTYNLKKQHDDKINEFLETTKTNETIKDQFEQLQKELNELKYLSVINNKTVKEEENEINEMIKDYHKEQIKKWTGLDCGYILFDSYTDGWDTTDSVFAERLLGKSNVLICCCGFRNDLVGGFVKSLITQKKKWIRDENAFMFMIDEEKNIAEKYDCKDPQFAFSLCEDSYKGLCGFGKEYDILFPKKGRKIESTPITYLTQPISKSYLMRKIIAIQLV